MLPAGRFVSQMAGHDSSGDVPGDAPSAAYPGVGYDSGMDRPQFSLRGMFVAVTVVGVALGVDAYLEIQFLVGFWLIWFLALIGFLLMLSSP